MKKLYRLCLVCFLCITMIGCSDASDDTEVEEEQGNSVVCTTMVGSYEYTRSVTYDDDGTLLVYTEKFFDTFDTSASDYENAISNFKLYIEGFQGYDGVTAIFDNDDTTMYTLVSVDLATYDYDIDVVKLSSKVKNGAFDSVEGFREYWEDYSHTCE